MRLFHNLGPLIHRDARPMLRPPVSRVYHAPDSDHHSWPTLLSEEAPIQYHTRVNLVGARIPQELFDNILIHVAQAQGKHTGTTEFSEFSKISKKPTSQTDLRSYTLVCRHWANKCRQFLFDGAVLTISSAADMDEFIQYASHGCPLLVPLHKVISGVHILQTYDGTPGTRSFCHYLPFLKFANVPVRTLELCGPTPFLISSRLPKSPHWGLPPTIATPPSMLSGCCTVTARNIHMRSFSHAVQFVRHFASVPLKPRLEGYGAMEVTASITYRRVTWDDRRIYHSPIFRKPALFRRGYTPD